MALTQVQSEGIGDGEVKSADLENSGVTAGTYGSSSAIPALTVDAKGRITSASTNAINIDSTSISNGTSNVSVANNSDITFVNAGNQKAKVDAQGFLFSDNNKARFGTSGDLEIYHSGGHSIIADVGTGQLRLWSNAFRVQNAAGTETQISTDENGAVNLAYDGADKISTTSGGINVTGTVTCDGLTSDGQAVFTRSADYQVVCRDSNNTGTSTETGIAFQDSASTVQGFIGHVDNGNDHLYVSNVRNGAILFQTNNTTRCYVDNAGHFTPNANNTYDLGSSSYRWRNVYTNDLNLSNEGSANDVDGTWGSWTIQEGEDDLFLLNRRNGKKYKFNLTEVN